MIFKYMLANSALFLFVMTAGLLAVYGAVRLLMRPLCVGSSLAPDISKPRDR